MAKACVSLLRVSGWSDDLRFQIDLIHAIPIVVELALVPVWSLVRARTASMSSLMMSSPRPWLKWIWMLNWRWPSSSWRRPLVCTAIGCPISAWAWRMMERVARRTSRVDSFSYTFQGDAISVWGALENAQAGYTVSIDGSSLTSYTGNSASLPHSLPSFWRVPAASVPVITSLPSPTRRQARDRLRHAVHEPRVGLRQLVSGFKIVGAILGCVLFTRCFAAYLLFRKKDASDAAATRMRGGRHIERV